MNILTRLRYLPAAWRVTKCFDDATHGASQPPAGISSNLVTPARCPHCGGKADLESGESIYDKAMQRQLYYAAVQCSNRVTCNASVSLILNDEDAARTMCLEQWNRRYKLADMGIK